MPAEQEVTTIMARVRQLLLEAQSQGVHLRVIGQRYDDEWLFLVVEPTQPGERASQHAHLMTRIEGTLEQEGYDQVLLVPVVPEHAGLLDVPG